MITGEISTSDLHNSNLEVYHVKLTDSCLKALENAAAKTGNETCQLELYMKDGNSGNLTISQDNGKRTFNIISSDIKIDPKGSFDCVKRSRETNFCQSLASVRRKLTIQATDDTYSATREKIQLAEIDAKKNQTKQIKSSSSRKTVRRGGTNASPADLPYRKTAVSHNEESDAGEKRKKVPPIMRQSAAIDKVEALINKTQAGGAPSSLNKSESDALRLSEHSLRERVVHLLALKAYTEPEILLRLKKDGLSDSEKTRLHTVLSAVGQPNRQSKYLLLPKLFEEVQLNWPAYSASDREVISKRRASTLRVPSSAPQSTANSASSKDGFHQSSARRQTRPMPLAGGGQSVLTEQKLRAIADIGGRRHDEEVLRQVALKYCVSRDTLGGWVLNEEMLRARRAKELGIRVEELPSPYSKSSSSSAVPKRPNPAAAQDEEGGSPSKRACPRLPSPVSDVSPNSCCRASPRSPTPVNSGQGGSQAWANEPLSEPGGRGDDVEEAFEVLFPDDFIKDYPDIRSDEQKAHFKSDFKRDYKEYRDLYLFITQSIERLRKLEEELDLHSEKSPEYERVGSKIVTAVDALHRDGKNPRELRRRLDYLDAKLSHIKKQVHKYKNRTSASGGQRV